MKNRWWLRLGALSWREYRQYPQQLIAELLTLTARCGVLLALYAYVFAIRGGDISGATYVPVAWSIFLYFALSSWRLRNISSVVASEVYSGQVETLLTRPINYVYFRTISTLYANIVPAIVVLLVGASLLTLTVGLPPIFTNWHFWLFAPMVFINCVVLSLTIYMIVGHTAFWLEESQPVFWVVDKATMILGGAYFPVALFPPYLLAVAKYSPFGASQFITHTVYDSFVSDWLELLGIQLIWILLASLMLSKIHKKALLKLTINGG